VLKIGSELGLDSRNFVVSRLGNKKCMHEELFELSVDIIVPASIPDVINEKNVDTHAPSIQGETHKRCLSWLRACMHAKDFTE